MNHFKQNYILQSKDRIKAHLDKLYRVKVKTKVTLFFIDYWEKKLNKIKINE